MKKFKYNRWLLLFIVVGLLAALVVDVQRYQVEKQNMTVDMAIDYEGLVELAEREGLPPEEVFRQAKEAGITSLAVYETTFKKLNVNGKATATPGSAILENYQSGALTDPAWRALVQDGTITGTKIYVTGHDAQTFREVKEDLLRVKDALDLYLRTSQNDPAVLQPQAEALQRVSDTLGMLGLGLARTLVQQQRDAMQEIVDGKRKAGV